MSVTRFFICFQVPFQPPAMRHMQHNNKRSACIKEILEILTVFISFVIQTKRDNTNQISCAAYTLSSPPHTYVCLLTRNAPQNIFLTYVYCATDITPRVLGHPNPILCLPSESARKAFQVTFRRALVSLLRFMSFLLQFIPARRHYLVGRCHSPPPTLSLSLSV